MTKKTNEPSGWNPVFEFPLDDRNTIIIDGVKYKRIEEPKSPAEEAYKRVYGWYPPTTPSVSNYEDNRWSVFQNGYNSSKEDYKVGEYQPTPQKSEKEQQIKELVRESVKWCEEHPEESVEDYLRPQTPEQVAAGLKEAFGEAVKKGVVSSSTKPQNLTDLIYDWWEDVFTTNSNDDMETSIDDLVERIKHWLPKEQSAAGTQNAYVECSVEGFNDCLKKIKEKLR